jgi:hypothetical protein
MESSTRGKFLVTGSIIAFFGFLVPGVYGVSYNPPAHSAAASINIGGLDGFGGPFSSASGGVYNGFGGPADFHVALTAILIMFGLGLFALKFDIERGIAWLRRTHHWASISAGLIVVWQFIWAFRSGGTPPAITQKFIADLGGSQSAITASNYLSGLLGFGTLILFFGLLLGFVGASPKFGGKLLALFCLVFVGLLLYTRVSTGAW